MWKRLPSQEEHTLKASITIHVETLWTNRAELTVEAELENPDSATKQEVVSLLFETAQLMALEARAENERALFGEEAMNKRYRELDEREIRLEERDKRLSSREAVAGTRNHVAAEREAQADIREREQMEHDVRVQRE
jgi:hypothetical protein